MNQASKTLIASACLACLTLFGLHPNLPTGKRLLAWAFDWSYTLGTWAQPKLTDSPVTIVYLDTETYQAQQQDPNLPFPRSLHAKALARLTEIGVRAVVYDIVFTGPHFAGDENEDRAFTDAIAANGQVILGADLNRNRYAPGSEVWVNQMQLDLPYEPFRNAAASWGLVQLRYDDDFVVRSFFPGFLTSQGPSLATAAAQYVDTPESHYSQEQNVYYYGPPFEIPNISLQQLLLDDGIYADHLRDKIVIIGARPATESFDDIRDEARTPFGSWSEEERPFMPGVEVHATQLINLLRQDGIRSPSFGATSALLALSALVLVWFAFRLSIRGMILFTSIGIAFVMFSGILLFHTVHWGLPWTHVALVQFPIVALGNIATRSTHWYRQRRAFQRAKRVADAKIQEQATLLNRAHDAIVVLSATGEIVYHNQSAEDLFGSGKNNEQTNTLSLWEELSPKLLQEARQQTLSTGVWEGEFEISPAQQPVKKIESRWTQIRDPEAEVHSIMTISADVTEKRQLEQQLLQAQRMDTIGALAGGVAHDLNNALSPILMGVQLLRRQDPTEKTSRMLEVMESSTQRGAEMVRQILAFTRGSGDDRRPVHLKTLVADLEHMVRETFPKNITITTYVASDLKPFLANPTQLHQVLLNLCVNARDAMPHGGELSIVVDVHEQEDAVSDTLGQREPGNYVSIMITDSGSGIPEETVKQVFEPFFSTKQPGRGTGLGLTTVKNIVEKHHGSIDLSSEPNVGTTFEIYFPIDAQSSAELANTEDHPLPTGNGERILIADDEQAVREMIASTLEASGYAPMLASNGSEAISCLGQNQIDLAILDNDMPMMSGRQCLNEIRESWPDLPVLLISGDIVQNEKGLRSEDPRCTELPKPFRVDALLEQVGLLLRNN